YLSSALDELEGRSELLRVLIRDYPYMNQIPAIAHLPRRMAELTGLSLQHWASEVSLPQDPATYYVLANMLGGAYLAQTLKPAGVDREAILGALVEIMIRVLKPGQGSSPPPQIAKAV